MWQKVKGNFHFHPIYFLWVVCIFYIVRPCITFVLRGKKVFLVSVVDIKGTCPLLFKTALAVKTQILKIISLYNTMDGDTLVISNAHSMFTSIISFNPWHGFVR